MRAELVFTGSELLMGYVQNTHAQFLSEELAKLGIEVTLHSTVGDQWEAMVRVIGEALERSDLVITTGGLGPTTDDITKDVIAHLLGLPMLTDEASLADIRVFFRDKRGREMPTVCERQAMFPTGAVILPNYKGTAPGALIEKDGKVIILLPGPPNEVRSMFRGSVLPYLSGIPGRGDVVRTRVLKLTGIAEYGVQKLLKDLGGQGNPGLGYLTVPGEVQIWVSGKHADAVVAEALVEDLVGKVLDAVGDYVFGFDDEVLEKSVARLLIDTNLTISAAESCTAGMVAGRLTNIPGSSRYFLGGIVVYSNEMKTTILGVPAKTIAEYGAVSAETAVAMAEGVRSIIGGDLGLAISGIAGPGGATAQKPLGLVHIALATPRETICRHFRLPGERIGVRVGAVNSALNILKRYLEGYRG
ncbi:MAG: competence/damage-inducible protein A [Eubacteriales bacterium]|jgi:nicotinamide-nucleotide amidase|nr:competence/damage-inducible protein A [Bacillota bacterium]MBV1726738.1 competence/damage-inducible protein A [Desulforudis sp.]MDP3051768.1 competence/damage-inducible protein A [Eubacteriales bacterium]MDQ7790067.1 competence/damage-inducible protein A [Clostridia bacterium]MBV1735642.1 competence/damage-inducible protein A [Desulforudis sp.]